MSTRKSYPPKPIIHLLKPVYVIQMNWDRVSDKHKIKWAHELREACQETIRACDRILERLSNND